MAGLLVSVPNAYSQKHDGVHPLAGCWRMLGTLADKMLNRETDGAVAVMNAPAKTPPRLHTPPLVSLDLTNGSAPRDAVLTAFEPVHETLGRFRGYGEGKIKVLNDDGNSTLLRLQLSIPWHDGSTSLALPKNNTSRHFALSAWKEGRDISDSRVHVRLRSDDSQIDLIITDPSSAALFDQLLNHTKQRSDGSNLIKDESYNRFLNLITTEFSQLHKRFKDGAGP